MSDTSANQAPSFSLDSVQPNQQPVAPVVDQQVASPTAPQEPQLSDYAKGILGQVADTDRDVISKYLPQWDAGVARRITELQGTYAPFDPLLQEGWTAQDLNAAARLYDMLESDPQAALDVLNRNFGSVQQGGSTPAQQPQGNGQQPAQLPPEVQQQFGKIDQFMERMAQDQQARQQADQQIAQDKALDEYMGLLKREKGDFDENYVLSRMSAGVQGDVAVDEFNRMVEQRVQAKTGSSQLPAVPILNGGSAVAGQKPIHEASAAERRAAVMQILQNANRQGS